MATLPGLSVKGDFKDFFDEVDATIREWTPEARKAFIDQINYLGMGPNNVPGDIRKDFKLQEKGDPIDRVRFIFPRYGVFVEKGVGRGHPINRIETQKGNGAILASASAGRTPKPWFNPVLIEQHKELAYKIAERAPRAYLRDVKNLMIN